MITGQDVILEYALDIHRDDDLDRWGGEIGRGDFYRWKRTLQSGEADQVNYILDNHQLSPEMSCTYGDDNNEERWYNASKIINTHTSIYKNVIEIGAGSHARIAQHVLRNTDVQCYIICDLVSPLLLAYHNISKQYDVHYVRHGEPLETLIDQHRCILLPHHMTDELYKISAALYYNSYSLSEMSKDEITKYIDIILSTNSRLITENYMFGSGRCHLCNNHYTPLQEYIPDTFNILYKSLPHHPTNPGSELLILQ